MRLPHLRVNLVLKEKKDKVNLLLKLLSQKIKMKSKKKKNLKKEEKGNLNLKQ